MCMSFFIEDHLDINQRFLLSVLQESKYLQVVIPP